MSNDGKKISFSFSKVKKPTLVNKPNFENKEKKDFVDCFDGSKGKFSYKGNVRNDDEPKKELVIPMVSTGTSSEIIKARIEERARNKEIKKLESNDDDEEKKKTSNGDSSKLLLEEIAAREILNELQNSKAESKSGDKLIIDANGLSLQIADSSEADIDYDNVPVSDFGLAMLRGMGWKPNTGIGKEPKMVAPLSPKLRPKGLGLGAKPVAEQKNDEKKSENQTEKHSEKYSEKHSDKHRERYTERHREKHTKEKDRRNHK